MHSGSGTTHRPWASRSCHPRAIAPRGRPVGGMHQSQGTAAMSGLVTHRPTASQRPRRREGRVTLVSRETWLNEREGIGRGDLTVWLCTVR
jgi:hypothetical protein